MNQQLTALYARYWQGFITNEYLPLLDTPHAAAFPFLIKATQHYIHAPRKIMICGQETQGWGGIDGTILAPEVATVEMIQGIYDGFVNHRKKDGTILKPGYNSPYWNFNWRIMSSNPTAGFVFQNIVKVGKAYEAGCDDTIDALSHQHFPVFLAELRILQPDLIIFLTGPNYDWRIRTVMGNFQKERLANSPLCFDRLTFDTAEFPPALRLYHPGYLQRNGKYAEMIAQVNAYIKQHLYA